jgi:hypothetical protein
VGKEKGDAWYERVKRDGESKHDVTLPDPILVEIHN